MGVKVTGLQGVRNFTEACINELNSQVQLQLNYLGQECVEMTRKRSKEESWIDRTGNLRSSIGAAVVEGKRTNICQGLTAESSTATEGVGEAKKAISEAASSINNTYGLVVVAGMEYASYVENMNGKDVLASTELWARKELEGRIKDAVDNAAYRINKMAL